MVQLLTIFRKCAIKDLSMLISSNDDVTLLTIQLLTIFRKCVIKHLSMLITLESVFEFTAQKRGGSYKPPAVFKVYLKIIFRVRKNWKNSTTLPLSPFIFIPSLKKKNSPKKSENTLCKVQFSLLTLLPVPRWKISNTVKSHLSVVPK